MSTAVELDNITISYDRHPAVHHVSGRFDAGSLTAVTGPNGGGKSTLLKAIAGLIKPGDGHIHIHNIKPGDIAYLPQTIQIQRDFPLSVLEMVAAGSWRKAGLLGSMDNGICENVTHALELTGLQGFENRLISSLSLGQFQRALFARLILQDAKLILLDEPFSAVDEETVLRLFGLIGQWQREGRTIICVLHDPVHIGRYFPQCLLLARECLAWGKTQDVWTQDYLLRLSDFNEAWNPGAELCDL